MALLKMVASMATGLYLGCVGPVPQPCYTAFASTCQTAEATDGFSGAEIEESIVSALYSVFADGRPLTTEALVAESAKTRPLSRIMAERLVRLRQWASIESCRQCTDRGPLQNRPPRRWTLY